MSEHKSSSGSDLPLNKEIVASSQNSVNQAFVQSDSEASNEDKGSPIFKQDLLNDTSNFNPTMLFDPPIDQKPDQTMDFDVSFSKELAEAEFVPNNLVNSIEKTNEMINMYKPQNNDYLIFDQNSPEPEKMSHDSNIFRKKP